MSFAILSVLQTTSIISHVQYYVAEYCVISQYSTIALSVQSVFTPTTNVDSETNRSEFEDMVYGIHVGQWFAPCTLVNILMYIILAVIALSVYCNISNIITNSKHFMMITIIIDKKPVVF